MKKLVCPLYPSVLVYVRGRVYTSHVGYQQSHMSIVVHADLLHNDTKDSWQS